MENTVLNIAFWLDYDGCKNEYFPVSVRKEDRDSTECQLRLYRDGSCNGTGTCYCDAKNRTIMFSRFVNTSDAGNWLWMTKSEHSTIEKVLFFNVTGACFQFPTLADGHSVNTREGDIITLPFTLKHEKQCNVPENFVLKVTKVADTSPLQCVLFHKNGSCQDQDQGKADTKCTCNSRDGLYRLIHKANSLPSFWVWSVTGDYIQDHNITFQVTVTDQANENDLTHTTGRSLHPSRQPEESQTTVTTTSSTTSQSGQDTNIYSWITAGSAVVVAAVAVCYAACRYCGRTSGPAAFKSQSVVFQTSSYHSELGSQPELLPRRLAHFEECVMIPNFLYEGSASVLDIPHDENPPMFDINKRPPAPLPGETELEGDYAEVNENQERDTDGYQACFSANDYVPIKEIQARKRQAEEAAQSTAEAETDPSVQGSDKGSDEQTRL